MRPLVGAGRNAPFLKRCRKSCGEKNWRYRILWSIFYDCILNRGTKKFAVPTHRWVNHRWWRKIFKTARVSKNVLMTVLYLCLIIKVAVCLPNKARQTILCLRMRKQLVHQDTEVRQFDIIN